MPVRISSLTVLLASSALLLAGGCAPQSEGWPGKSQGQMGEPQVSAAGVEPVQAEYEAPQVVAVADPALSQRLSRLEQNVGGLESDVADLQTEMTDARPRLAKIESMEKHFRQLSLELDRINKTYDVAPAAAPKPPAQKPVAAAPAPAPKKPVKLVEEKKMEAAKATPPVEMKKPAAKPEAKKAAGPLKVSQVRIGEQAGGKSRIVLDTTAPAKLNYDIDNAEKILVIEVPDAAWAASQSQTLKNSSLISSYKAESDASGSHLIVQLKEEAQVLSASRLDPEKGAGYRVFLDLGKK